MYFLLQGTSEQVPHTKRRLWHSAKPTSTKKQPSHQGQLNLAGFSP